VTKIDKIFSGNQPRQVAIKNYVSRAASVLIIRELICLQSTAAQSDSNQSGQVYFWDILGSIDISVP
jgi:hypothetical protein